MAMSIPEATSARSGPPTGGIRRVRTYVIDSWTTSVVIELAARTVSIHAVAFIGCRGQSTA